MFKKKYNPKPQGLQMKILGIFTVMFIYKQRPLEIKKKKKTGLNRKKKKRKKRYNMKVCEIICNKWWTQLSSRIIMSYSRSQGNTSPVQTDI